TCTLYPYTTLFRSNQARRNTLHLLRRRIGRPRLEHFFSRHLACRRGERVIPGLFVNENLQFKRPRFRFAEQPRRQCIERAFAEPVKEMGAAHPTETTLSPLGRRIHGDMFFAFDFRRGMALDRHERPPGPAATHAAMACRNSGMTLRDHAYGHSAAQALPGKVG